MVACFLVGCFSFQVIKLFQGVGDIANFYDLQFTFLPGDQNLNASKFLYLVFLAGDA